MVNIMKFVVSVLTVRGCDTGTPTVRAIKLMAITMKTATIDQIFIFLDFKFGTIILISQFKFSISIDLFLVVFKFR